MQENQSSLIPLVTIVLIVLPVMLTATIGIIGWLIKDKLNSINENIKDLKTDLKNNTNVVNEHESRITVLESKYKVT